MKNPFKILPVYLVAILIPATFVSISRAKFPGQNPVYYFSKDSLKKHTEYLGSDLLQGRGTGTAGGERAAKYIAKRLKEYGIRPLGDNNTFFQNIPMHSSVPLPDSRLRFFNADSIHDFELKRDYLLYKTGAQTFIPNPVPLVFVGYGIIAPEFDYNDYQSVDVRGKIVVYLSGEPFSEDPAYFDGPNNTVYALAESKQRFAISRGALGSIMIPNPRLANGRDWRQWQHEFAFEDVTLAYTVSSQLSLVMNENVAALLFAESPYSWKNVLRMDSTLTLRSFPLNGRISFKGEFIERDFTAPNLIGILPGSDPGLKDSYLIINAHYDHLGVGPPMKNDSIYNGVLDNALGVSAVLEMARVSSKLPTGLKRSVIFILATGEEKGLLGSTYYCDHPAKPLYKTVAAINVDGIAFYDTFNEVVGVGAELSTLGEQLSAVARRIGLIANPVPPLYLSRENFYRSDQIAYAKAGIPSVLILEGLDFRHHSQNAAQNFFMDWMEHIYHSPFDNLSQQINYDAAVEHTHTIFALACSLANSKKTPEWKPSVPYKNIRFQTLAEKR